MGMEMKISMIRLLKTMLLKAKMLILDKMYQVTQVNNKY